MQLEILNTGSELMLGRVLNTHQQWLCRRLADMGYEVARQVAVPDTGPAIQRAVCDALGRADFIICTGGLGPTSDDLTRDLIAELLGRKLKEDKAIVAHIEQFFLQRQRPMPASTRVQAMVPEGARVLPNARGTAPGLAMEVSPNPFRAEGKTSWLVMLPGPPREMHPMFREQVVPLLREKFPLDAVFVCRTLRSTGLGESVVQEKIEPALKHLTGLEIGYCARTGEVDVRLVARGGGADQTVAEAERIVQSLIGRHVFGTDDESLESAVVRLLAEQRSTLTLAESCTGGYIGHRITNVPGASAVLLAGLVTYSNDAKQKFLGVRTETLSGHGAVSEAVVREMAEGAIAATGADYALAVTGIAGPGGGSPEKPVGTVFLGLAGKGPTLSLRRSNAFDRETFKFITSQQALEMLRRRLLKAE
ncbi:MAG: competence/damage-inducible protein A [Verrucomicrobiota bacterium]